jgi:hypothetical protein
MGAVMTTMKLVNFGDERLARDGLLSADQVRTLEFEALYRLDSQPALRARTVRSDVTHLR